MIGVLVVDNKFNAKPITDEDVEFLSAFAIQAGLAVENARVFKTSRTPTGESSGATGHPQERLAALGRDGRPRGP